MIFKKIPFFLATLFLSSNATSIAQIIPDHSLPVNSTVINKNNIIIINDGSQAGQNLFHSFQEFSIQNGQTALFNNGLDIQNIFSRVTGSSISQINGILSANGTANVFFLNPNGIVFGNNGQIAIGGSFFGTTANKILFADGFEFNTSTSLPNTLLTMSRPIGMGLSNPGQIVVKGTGHQLRKAIEPSSGNVLGVPILGGAESTTGLRTAPNQTLGLIGGEIIIDGGILTAFSGQIELASVKEGMIKLDQLPIGFNFNYENVSKFDNILIENQGLLDASGFSNGTINVTAKNLSIQDGGTIFISNLGNTDNNSINIKATELVNIKGINDFNDFIISEINGNNVIRGIFSETLSSGKGADVNISAKDITIESFSQLNTLNVGTGAGGSLNLQVEENLTIDSNNPLFFFLPSTIGSFSLDTGKAGDISISGKKVTVQNGGIIISQPLGIGEGGDIKIKVSDLVISGAIPVNQEQTDFSPSNISINSFVSENVGNINISADKLNLNSGGSIFANTNGSGNGSNIFITANSVQIDGSISNDLPSQIASSADQPSSFFIELFNLPPFPAGDSGSININTKELSISNQGVINVRNEGTGNAGNININADNINLNGGNISATTLSGKGGNINLTAQDISLINNSNISATAGGQGDGGNILINSDSLLMKSSQITADAFEGRGGNILINTEVFLISNNSVIKATSELGIDGVVEINTPENNLKSVVVPVKAQILELDPRVAQQCLNKKGEKELLRIRKKNAVISDENNPEPIEEPSYELIDLTENMSEAEKKFYTTHVPPNALIRTEKGDFVINLCLKEILTKG